MRTEKLIAVRDKQARYLRFELKRGEVFVGTLFQHHRDKRWCCYFDQERDWWPMKDWHSKFAALRAARHAYEHPRPIRDQKPYRMRIESRALLAEMQREAREVPAS